MLEKQVSVKYQNREGRRGGDDRRRAHLRLGRLVGERCQHCGGEKLEMLQVNGYCLTCGSADPLAIERVR